MSSNFLQHLGFNDHQNMPTRYTHLSKVENVYLPSSIYFELGYLLKKHFFFHKKNSLRFYKIYHIFNSPKKASATGGRRYKIEILKYATAV